MITIVSSGHKSDDERIYHIEIKTLLNAGYNIIYFTRCNNELNLSEKNLQHINLKQKDYSIFQFIQYIDNNLNEQTNILHIHEFELLPLLKKIKRKYLIKTIYDVHDDLRKMWDTFSTRSKVMKYLINKLLSIYEIYHLKFIDKVILANQQLLAHRDQQHPQNLPQ